MMREQAVAWRRTDEYEGHSVARFEPSETGLRCRATEVLAGSDLLLSCTFVVELGSDWSTRRVRVEAFDRDLVRTLDLTADAQHRWRRDGVAVPELDGCVDVDIAATPVTNTFPILRLARLAEGAAVTIPVAWVDVPSLSVQRVEQTYTRLGPLTWRYHDDDHGAFVLQVDEDAVVIDYEGFAERIP